MSLLTPPTAPQYRVTLFYGPDLAPGDHSRLHCVFNVKKRSWKAGIQVALQGGYESYVPRTRVVLFEAAEAAAYGLSFEDALALITIDAARLLGIEARVGSLEPGKDGDLALYDGDPFEYTTHCTGVVIDGVVVSSTPR